MERKNVKQKNLISVFLLVVGVLFVLVAGGIFVTTAWQYLPIFVKQLTLLVVAGGLYGFSAILEKNEKLQWIGDTLFHLGNAFVGFFVIAVTGGLAVRDDEETALSLLMASGAMAIPVFGRWLMKKKVVDYVVLVLLIGLIIFTGCVAFELGYAVYLIMLTVFVIGLVLLDCKLQCNPAVPKGVLNCSSAVTFVHMIGYTGIAAIGLFTDDLNLGVVIIVAAAMLFMTGYEYKVRGDVDLRVWNSVTAMVLPFVLVGRILHDMQLKDTFSVTCIVAILINALLMVVLKRKECIGVMIAFAVMIPYGQLACYWLDAFNLFSSVDSDWSVTYIPYSLVIAVAFIVLFISENGADKLSNWLNSKTLSFAGVQLMKVIFIWVASKSSDMWGMVFFLLGMTEMLEIAIVAKNNTAKKVFLSLGIAALTVAIGIQPFMEIPEQFVVEWFSVMVVLGMMMFRALWYDKKEKFSILYFLVTCILLGILLINNIYQQNLVNLMFLGVTGIVMLLVAAMKNNKKYVIVSATTLILLVFYLTREFWLSIAWWVYLFVAGVVLIFLAVKKEKEM